MTIFYVVFLIVVEYIWGGHTPGPIKHKPEVWTDVFAVIPVICFGYQVSIYLVFVESLYCSEASYIPASVPGLAAAQFTY